MEAESKLGRKTAVGSESSWRWNISKSRKNGARRKPAVESASIWRWKISQSRINWEPVRNVVEWTNMPSGRKIVDEMLSWRTQKGTNGEILHGGVLDCIFIYRQIHITQKPISLNHAQCYFSHNLPLYPSAAHLAAVPLALSRISSTFSKLVIPCNISPSIPSAAHLVAALSSLPSVSSIFFKISSTLPKLVCSESVNMIRKLEG